MALRLSPEIDGPGVWGLRRPVLLLPDGIAEHLAPAELEAVLLHELEHVRRRDNLFGLFQTALRCLYWFHPLVWWLERRMLAERERACDDRVVALGAAPRLYAKSLLKVVRFGLAGPMVGVSAAAASDLRRRIEYLTGDRRPARLGTLHRGAAAAAVSALLFLSVAAAGQAACNFARLCTTHKAKLYARYDPATAMDGVADSSLLPPPPPAPAGERSPCRQARARQG